MEGYRTRRGYHLDIRAELFLIFTMLYMDYKDRIRHILTAHEQGASHAADGYKGYRKTETGNFATSGPGAYQILVTGIATAYMDSIHGCDYR